MNWSSGSSARYYASFVDPASWKDRDRFEIVDGAIRKSLDDLIEAADITCTSSYTETSERWIRIWLDARQTGSSSHIPLFTGLAMSPGRSIDGRKVIRQVQCYSVLKPAQDILLERGWYAPAGINGGTMIKELLSVTPAPIDIEPGSQNLTNAIIAEAGETRLTMALRILSAIGWRIKIDGDGTVHVLSPAKTPVKRFDSLSNDVIETKVDINYDWYDCPNVFRAIIGDTVAVARDDNPNSQFSTVTRGREIWVEDMSAQLNKNESAADYAKRMLQEYQKVYLTMSYDRRFDPDVNVTDIVQIHYPAQGITGDYLVTSQSISLSGHLSTSEEVRQA